MTFLEPCAGDGAIIRAVNDYRTQHGKGPVHWSACELRARMRQFLEPHVANERIEIGDYLDPESFIGNSIYDVTITNPPFYLAEQILRRAMQHSRHVVLLLRLNFLGSERRHEFLRTHMPDNIYVLPNRPSFRGDNKTDSIEYAWFHWEAPFEAKYSATHLLDLTATEERRVPAAAIHDAEIA